MISCVAALVLLLLATYTDLRTRRIPNALTYPFILLGLFFLPFRPLFEVLYALAGVVLAYLFYRLGVWAGGDAKLFFALSLLLSSSLFGVPAYLWLVLGSVLLGGAVAALYVFYKVITTELRREAIPFFLHAAIRAFSFAVFLKSFGLLGILPSLLPSPLAFFSALALFLAFPDLSVLITWVGIFFTFAFFYLLSLRSRVFSRDVPVNGLREGDVPAEIVTLEGRKIPLDARTALLFLLGKISSVVDPFKARGLTAEEIQALRELGVKSLRIRTTVPFVPFVLLSLILLISFTPICA